VAELRARVKRLAQLARTEREMELQRHLMGKGSKKNLAKRPKGELDFGDEEEDDAAFGKSQTPKKKATPEPFQDKGVTTGARVWVCPPSHSLHCDHKH
jgi:U3 small nucleolar RNA-associated protein 11